MANTTQCGHVTPRRHTSNVRRFLIVVWVTAALYSVPFPPIFAAPGDSSPAPPPLQINYEELLTTQISILETLDKIDDDIERRSIELNQLQDERQRLSVNLVALEVQAEETTDLIQKTRQTIRTRLYSIIMARRSASIDFLFNPEHYMDNIRKERTLRLMLDDDKRRINAYREQLAAYRLEQNRLDSKRNELVKIETVLLLIKR